MTLNIRRSDPSHRFQVPIERPRGPGRGAGFELLERFDMKYFAAMLLVGVVLTFARVAIGAEFPSPDLGQEANAAAKMIRETIGNQWDVTVQDRTIQIESRCNIYRVSLISRASAPPDLHLSEDELE